MEIHNQCNETMKNVFFTIDKSVSPALTSTSANHIANMAKEYTKKIQSKLDNIKFYHKTVNLLGTPDEKILHEGCRDTKGVSEALKEISDATSLIAWLREAIKAKENLTRKVTEKTFNEWLEERDITLEKENIKPEMTEKEYYDSLPIKERFEYYALDTRCSVLGKYIHPDGKFAVAREELHNIMQNPSELRQVGSNVVITTKKPSIPVQEVDDLFFELNKEYRETQARLNVIKHRCDDAIKTDFLRYQNELREYYTRRTDEIQGYEAEFRKWNTNQLKEIQKLKIVIPDKLLSVYNRISELGK